MKLWTIIIKIISVVFTALWIVLICASIANKQNHLNPGAEAFDFYTGMIYNVFIIVGITGFLSSGILMLCIFTFSDDGQTKKDAILWIAYFSAIIANCVFYRFWYGIFFQKTDITFLPPVTWFISLLACFGLLTDRWIEKLLHRQHPFLH